VLDAHDLLGDVFGALVGVGDILGIWIEVEELAGF
jgi:hypothetical protein